MSLAAACAVTVLATTSCAIERSTASDVPPGPYAMGALIRDTERLMDHFALRDAVVLGLSIGGLIAQGLAVKRLDLVRAMILSNTAAKIGRPEQWQDRIAALRAGGMSALHDATMERWLGRKWQDNPALPRLSKLFLNTNPEGWSGCASAIAGTDFYETTATLPLPPSCPSSSSCSPASLTLLPLLHPHTHTQPHQH